MRLPRHSLASSAALLPVAVLCAVLALGAVRPPWLEEATLRVFDEWVRARPRTYGDARVRVVDIDDESLERVGQWPWPRTRVAALLEQLRIAGARVVAFDVVFAEPDRTSPGRLLEAWPAEALPEGLRSALRALPDHDLLLARQMARLPVVLGFPAADRSGGRSPARRFGLAWKGPDPARLVPAFPGAVGNLPLLEEQAAGVGTFSIAAERDALHRRLPLFLNLGGQLHPTLVLEALRVALGETTYLLRTEAGPGGVGAALTSVRVGRGPEIPTDARGRLWLHPAARAPGRAWPAWRLLRGEHPPAGFRDALVLVGASAAGLEDTRATVLDPVASGVEVHAGALEQILLGRFLVRPDWAPGAELVVSALLGLGLLALLRVAGAAVAAGVAAGAAGLAGAASWQLFVSRGLLLDPVLPGLAGALLTFAHVVAGFVGSEVQRRRLRGAFGRYLPEPLVAELAVHPERLVLGGETREMSWLFCDVRDFTRVSESLDPEDLTRLINHFLTPMTRVVFAHRGTIDKYMGDCVMAFWNAPLPDPEHARHACHAALGMLDALEEVNRGLPQILPGALVEPLKIGIGINTGFCCVGNLGSEQRFDYSVVGDEVNLASRLEGQSKTYGVPVVIGDRTRAAVPEMATLELDWIRVRGKLRPVRIHALLGDARRAADPGFRELARAHDAMRSAYRGRRFGEARLLAQACRQADPQLAPLYDLYLGRIDRLEEDPPGPDWDGVYTAETK